MELGSSHMGACGCPTAAHACACRPCDPSCSNTSAVHNMLTCVSTDQSSTLDVACSSKVGQQSVQSTPLRPWKDLRQCSCEGCKAPAHASRAKKLQHSGHRPQQHHHRHHKDHVHCIYITMHTSNRNECKAVVCSTGPKTTACRTRMQACRVKQP